VDAIVTDECAPLRSLLSLFNGNRVTSTAFQSRSAAFEQHPDYAILRPYMEVGNVRLALAQGDVRE